MNGKRKLTQKPVGPFRLYVDQIPALAEICEQQDRTLQNLVRVIIDEYLRTNHPDLANRN